jgi:hypothetical protein
MRRAHGVILCRETGSPIPNLVVAAFDSEHSLGVISNALRDHVEPREVWSRFGRRLGSVLTDARGVFDFDDALTHFSARAENPNLLIAVFAPEDVLAVDNPMPLPPERRILYISTLPRIEAGTQEAYVIRILRAQLERFSISVNGHAADATGHPGSVRYTDVLKRSISFSVEARRLMQGVASERLDALTKERSKAKNKLADLSAVRRDRAPFRATRPEATKSLVHQSIIEGIETISTGKPLEVRVSEEELAVLGIRSNGNGEVDTTVSAAAVARLLADRNGGVDLIRRQPSQLALDTLRKVILR